MHIAVGILAFVVHLYVSMSVCHLQLTVNICTCNAASSVLAAPNFLSAHDSCSYITRHTMTYFRVDDVDWSCRLTESRRSFCVHSEYVTKCYWFSSDLDRGIVQCETGIQPTRAEMAWPWNYGCRVWFNSSGCCCIRFSTERASVLLSCVIWIE